MKHDLINVNESLREPVKQPIERLPLQFARYVEQVCRYYLLVGKESRKSKIIVRYPLEEFATAQI